MFVPPAEEVQWLSGVGQRALCMGETLYSTWCLTEHVLDRKVPGDLVECGVFAGAQVAIMAKVLMRRGAKDRVVHALDSFQGIPHAGEHDVSDIDHALFKHGRDGALVSSGISVCTRGQVDAHLKEWGIDASLVRFHEGWFQNTLPLCGIGDIAFLRLDADLYESTLCCMRNLYDRVSKGGVVFADDWKMNGCKQAVFDYMAQTGTHMPDPVEVPGGGGPVFWEVP